MAKIEIYYFSSIPYNFIRQRPQQLYSEFVKKFGTSFDFFYVEPPNSYNFIKNLFSLKDFNDPNIITLYPSSHIFNRFSLFLNKIIIHKYFRRNSNVINKKIAIICTPSWEPFVTKDEFEIICYDYIDSIEVFSNKEDIKEIKSKHDELIAKSDIIFTTAKKLKEDIISKFPNKEVIMVSNGVDPHYFEKNSENNNNYKKNRKIIGYVGALFDWINIDLILKSANMLSNTDFILIGPLSNENREYQNNKPKNLFFLGRKDYKEIPAYINTFDVAIIPFKSGDISESTDPIKLYEYFSLGKPVVSTHLKQLEKFNNGKLLKIAKTDEEFVKSLNFFLDNDNKKWQNERKKIANENSWSDRANLMIKAIKNKLK